MGASLSWIAVRGCSPEEAAAALGLEFTGPAAPELSGRYAIGALPGGWTFVQLDNSALARGRFDPLLRFGPAVACSIEEHVMVMEARGYQDGAETWRIEHDPPEHGTLYHVAATGDLPAAFPEIHRLAIEQQDDEGGEDAGVDLISDVPLDVAASICGLKYGDTEPEGSWFRPVRKARRSGPGLLARLFGIR